MSLMEILSGVGTVLDTPRAMSWASAKALGEGDLLGAVTDPFEAMLDPSKRLTGWDLMKKLGVQNQEGFDATDVGAVGSEMVLDPLNVALMGAPWLAKKLLGAMGKGAKTVKGAKAAEGLTKGTGSIEIATKQAPGVLGIGHQAEEAGGRIRVKVPETKPFYSRAERAAESLKGEKFKTQSLRSMLKKYPEGVMDDEIDLIMKDLPSKGGVTTKEELLKHIKENGLKVEEKMYGVETGEVGC